MTCNNRRATLKLTPSAWATVANSCCFSGVISTASFSLALEGLDLGLPLGELPPKLVDLGLRHGAVDGLGDLPGLAVQRLS